MRKFDPRFNSPSGKGDPEPYTKSENITAVARALGNRKDNSAGLKFRIGENQAKKIDMDKAPA